MLFSMWRTDETTPPEAAYDRRAVAYDHLIRSRLYNRLAWGTSPAQYTDFARRAIASADGPLLEVAVGSAAATAELHAHSTRPTVLVDLSQPMLDRAARNLADAAGAVPPNIRLERADVRSLPFPPHGFTTVLGLGFTHLFDDLPSVISDLRQQLAPGGRLYVAGLVGETRRGRRYLRLLHRAGEVATPQSADELFHQLGRPEDFGTIGCMAYATLGPSGPLGEG